MDPGHAGLVRRNGTEGVDNRYQITALHPPAAQVHGLLQRTADAHGTRLRFSLIVVIGIDRDVVHAHVILTRLGRRDRGVHGVAVVQYFAVAVLRFLRVMRHAVNQIPPCCGTADCGAERDEKSHRQKTFHCASPCR